MNKRFIIFFISCCLFLILIGWQFIKPRSGNLQAPAVKIYFFNGEKLTAVNRTGNNSLRFALEQLFLGPTAQEQSNGFFSQIPTGLNFKDIRILPSLVAIIFDDSLKTVSGGTSLINGMLAQIVYTATQFSSVNYVNFELENKQDTIIIGGEGIVVDKPLSRQDFKEFE